MIQMLEILKTEAEERILRTTEYLLKLEKGDNKTNADLINKILRELHSLKGAARSVGILKLEEYIHSLEDIVKEYRNTGSTPQKIVIDTLLQGIDKIVPHISSILSSKKMEEPDINLTCEHISKACTPLSERLPDISDTIIGSSQIRLDVNKIHALSGIIGELFSIKVLDQKFYERIVAMKLITSRLKDEISRIILTEMIDSLSEEMKVNNFNRTLMYDELSESIRELSLLKFDEYRIVYERTLRDTAEELGKKIVFTVQGGENRIDKFLLEHISEAIMHLLRNSISHGIESKEERLAAGKKDEGEIILKLSKTGKNICIEVTDDGQGIDVEKIKKVLLRRNLVKEDDLKKMNDHEIMSYIFIPGFSTADNVSKISGQGIGMDVVRDVVSNLGGSIEINSEKGKGSNIKITLPVNLSTINGLLVYIDKHPYIIPVSFCTSIKSIKKEHIKEIGGRKSILTEYGAVPLFDLNKLVNIDIIDKEKSNFETLILHLGKDIAAFIVNGLSEKQEFIIKQLPTGIRTSVISGCSILSGGDIAYLINVQELFTKHILTMLEIGTTNTEQKEKTELKTTDNSKRKILLIDDSLTSRTVEKNIITSYGYAVDVASDGWEGFEKLNSSKYDLIITDIEMPIMNGFELLEKIRKTTEFQNIPVFIVTTLDSEEDRKKGLNAGADAYIVKTGMGEETLISMISRYLK